MNETFEGQFYYNIIWNFNLSDEDPFLKEFKNKMHLEILKKVDRVTQNGILDQVPIEVFGKVGRSVWYETFRKTSDEMVDITNLLKAKFKNKI